MVNYAMSLDNTFLSSFLIEFFIIILDRLVYTNYSIKDL